MQGNGDFLGKSGSGKNQITLASHGIADVNNPFALILLRTNIPQSNPLSTSLAMDQYNMTPQNTTE